jgi:acetyl esterase/lipase
MQLPQSIQVFRGFEVSLKNIDPEMKPGLDAYLSVGRTYDPEGLRAYRAQIGDFFSANPPARPASVNVTNVTIPVGFDNSELPIRIYRPAVEDIGPALYWMHGGGMMVGSIDMDDALLISFVEELGIAAVSVDYRLAPENPDPAPIEDCYAGLQWLSEHASDYGIDSNRIAVGGISAGAGLAAGLSLLARDRLTPHISFQLLLAPMLDDRCLTPSSQAYPAGIVWNSNANRIGWAALLGDRVGGTEVTPYAAPARASNLENLPAAFIDVGEIETFRDECVEYGQRLMQAGVSTELHVYRGAIHGFDVMAPDSAAARSAWGLRRAALSRALGLPTQ